MFVAILVLTLRLAQGGNLSPRLTAGIDVALAEDVGGGYRDHAPVGLLGDVQLQAFGEDNEE